MKRADEGKRIKNKEQPRVSHNILVITRTAQKALTASAAPGKGFHGFTYGFCTCWTLQPPDFAIAGLCNRLAGVIIPARC